MRHLGSLLWVSLALALSACRHYAQLEPGPTAQVVAGNEDEATAEVAGVQVVVDGHDWNGEPSDLPDLVTPVRVSIQNRSDWSLRVRYKEFALRSGMGFETRALPPFQIQRPGTAVANPYYPFAGFFVAAPAAGFWPGYPPWTGGFDFDAAYYDGYGQWQPALPTRDMLQKALPEGVLAKGGRITGYLYFHPLQKDVRDLDFTFDLVDADTQTSQGKVTIPLLVHR